MSEILCWNCNKEHGVEEGEIAHCQHCFVDIDRVPYKPITSEPYKEEEKMIIDSSAIKLPFLKKEDLASDSEVTIESEITQGGNFNQHMATVKLPDGSFKKAGFNMTSVSAMVSAWGNDTSEWLGKTLIYTIEDITNSKTKQVLKDCKIFRPVVDK